MKTIYYIIGIYISLYTKSLNFNISKVEKGGVLGE